MQKLIEQYISMMKMKNATVATVQGYSGALKRLSEKIDRPEDISLGTLSENTKEKNWCPGTTGYFLAVVSSFCKFLVGEGIITSNPLTNFPFSKLQSERRHYVLTDDEMERVVMLADKHLKPSENIAIRLLTETGMRRMELLNIKTANVNVQDRSIYLDVTKGSEPRTVFFTGKTADKIRAYLPTISNGKFFGNTDNNQLTATVKKVVSLAFPMDSKKLKEVSPHTFRHSFATSWLSHNRNPIILKRIMGWKSMTMMSVYEHLQTETLMKEYRQYEKKRG